MKSYHIHILGRVQGVGFRYFTLRAAQNHGVSGWVKNLPDGSVEIIATGSEDCLNVFLKAVSAGPSYSRVTNVEVDELQPDNKKKKGQSKFRIL